MTIQHQARPTDRAVAGEIRTHHAAMVTTLDELTTSLQRAAADKAADTAADARRALTSWFHDVLVPHADEEEATTYRAAARLPEGRLLIRSMVQEHVLVKRLVSHFEEADDARVAAAYGRAVFDVFESHQAKENEIILPLLLDAASLSLGEVVSAGHGHQLHHDHDHDPQRP